MRINSCYIENFGKISKFTYDFSDGLNIVEEENGWGKTTFAAFIKAMFYGLEYKIGKAITDRKRYMPWNGKKFGGYILYEKDGKQYKIERFFGKKDKEDTCIIYDMSKNIAVADINENIGEEIWKVDRDSYEKTAFITLSDSKMLNDIISSKLGNIDEQEADMETSSKAIESLETEIVKIKAKRGKGGLIGVKKEEIRESNLELRECKDSLIAIQNIEEWIKDEDKNLQKINDELNQIDEEQSRILLYEKKKQYLELISEYNKNKDDLEELERFFNGEILSEEELEKIRIASATYTNQNEVSAKYQLSKEEERELEELSFKFENGTPKSFEIEGCNRNITALSNDRTTMKSNSIVCEDKKEFERLERKYGKINIDTNTIEGYIASFNEVDKLKKEEQEINNEIKELEKISTIKMENPQNKKNNPLLFVGISFIVLGIFISTLSLGVGLGIAILGLVIGTISFLFNQKNSKENHSHPEDETIYRKEKRLSEIIDEKNHLKSGYLSFLEAIGESPDNIITSLANSKSEVNDYIRLKTQVSKREENIKIIEQSILGRKKQIESFLGKYFNIELISDYEHALSDLRKSVSWFDQLSSKNKSYQDAKNLVEKEKKYLKEKFEHYYTEFPVSINDAVNEISDKLVTLNLTQIAYNKQKGKKVVFELNNNVGELEGIRLADKQENQVLDNLPEKKKKLGDKKEKILSKITNFQKDINDHSQKADRVEDIESRITRLEEEIIELENQYNLLDITKDCMVEAKENLATKYMGDMSIAFEKYLKELNDQRVDQYLIDINLNVKVEHEGEYHDSSELSKGMKDLIQVCMRMALVEAVYKDVENPLLVLDDPFVNLDNDRLENATKLLEKISDEYQIVYFICHHSRSVM